MSNIPSIITEAREAFRAELKDLPKVSAKMFDLDERAGSAWVDLPNSLIIVNENNARSLNYYGGFEYVDSECIKRFDEYTIFCGLYCDRVDKALEIYEVNLDEEEGNLP